MKKNNTKPSTAILHYTAPPVIGGVEAVIQAHCKVFRKYDYPVGVIAGHGDIDFLADGTKFHLIPEMDTQHQEILDLSQKLEDGHIPDRFETMTEHLYHRLKGILGNYENLIIHNVLTKHFNIPLTSALLRLIEDGKVNNCVGWCHDFSWTSPNSRKKVHEGYPWDLLRMYRPEINYVTVSQERQKSLAQLFNVPEEQIQVVYNGVDPRDVLGFSPEGESLVNRLSLLESDLVLLMPVRVTKAKNIEYALNLLVELRALGFSPKLVITGPPDPHSDTIMDYYHQLQRLRQELDLDDAMHFVYESGPISGEPYEIEMDVVGDLYRISDIIFMPSHREGFGMPVLEAGLVGIPVICSNTVPAAVEIGDQDAILFDIDEDPSQLATVILEWSQTSHQHHFKHVVRTKFTWDAIFEHEILPLLDNA